MNKTPILKRVSNSDGWYKCHMENFGEQGGLGYPIEEARIGN